MPRRKITVSDWMRGAGASIRSGNGMSPFTTQKFINQAHDERIASAQRYPLATGKNKYSEFDPRNGRQGRFLDKYDHPTTERPHVHIVTNESQGLVIITATLKDGSHPGEIKLPITASGNEVNAAVQQMQRLI
jgi:hypothetical protein